MKLTRCELTNFGSYKHLEFDFSEAGLALVYGPTGAGKSALLDAAVWVLFGQTAKGGAVDDVKSWQSDGDATTGRLSVWIGSDEINIFRKRGTQNDLYWTESAGPPRRGKDLADTQKLLEARLGVSADRFLAAAYFHEFSATGSFFTAKAKDRRAVLEGLADLSLPAKVVEGCKSRKTQAKNHRDDLETRRAGLEGAYGATLSARERALSAAVSWTTEWSRRDYVLAEKIKNFEADKAKETKDLETKEAKWQEAHSAEIDALHDTLDEMQEGAKIPEIFIAELQELRDAPPCRECGAYKHSERVMELELQQVQSQATLDRAAMLRRDLCRKLKEVPPYKRDIELALHKENKYVEQLRELRQEVNPHVASADGYEKEMVKLKKEVRKIDKELNKLAIDLSDLDELCDISSQLRATLLQNIVSRVERDTNAALERHFDGEFRVSFSLTDDALDTEISKNGYSCNYKQLSKGQRSLLRLCFVVAIMKATADTLITPIRHAFLDESLDGLDAALKVKAFGLIEELNQVREYILVVEHDPGFQSLFHNKYRVELVGDRSELTRE